MGKKKAGGSSATIALNKRAHHDYFIDERFEAGLQLQGWEVKSLRAGRASIVNGYVLMKNGEAWLLGSQFTPLDAACTHTICDPDRTRKLLLNQREIDKITGFANRKGFTVIPLALYWKGSWVKCEIGICRGKKDYDKREDIKTRDWAREHQRIMKRGGR